MCDGQKVTTTCYHHQIIPLDLSPTKCKFEFMMMPTRQAGVGIMKGASKSLSRP
jgi:hypothetical protein